MLALLTEKYGKGDRKSVISDNINFVCILSEIDSLARKAVARSKKQNKKSKSNGKQSGKRDTFHILPHFTRALLLLILAISNFCLQFSRLFLCFLLSSFTFLFLSLQVANVQHFRLKSLLSILMSARVLNYTPPFRSIISKIAKLITRLQRHNAS